MNDAREQALWLVLGVVAAAFIAIEVYMISVITEVVRELNGRMYELECSVGGGGAPPPPAD